ncbi:class I SAM-dependent methyltransferase [Actinoplanes bogorensis]|uniref:Class I SAM-dependent methyltransferase n=1 Tax=Paractinoplanes bogorensis TaxID=1610840 RepID=A0ABS5Z2H3_9ACTN|nr:class I SAM-dependent methyltransferase [Actinoplanes bogorensis]MBU2669899.1 class I SAM-dependent methyltransferase [Actinoplanes bogorensis]
MQVPSLVRRRAATFRRAVGESYRAGGVPAALGEVVRLTGELFARPVRTWREQRLDRSRRLDTRAEPTIEPSGTFDDAVGYAPIPVHHFRQLLRALPLGDPREFALIDLGCGKGRTLVLAADHGFASVVGVELDARLAHIARANTVAVPAASVITGDATDYAFPPGPVVVFLFNPFGAATLTAVVTNLEISLKETPRRLIVAYFNPVHRDVLDDSPAFRLSSAARHWAIYESRTVRPATLVRGDRESRG